MKLLAVAGLALVLSGSVGAANGPINITAALSHSHSRGLGKPGRVQNSLQEQWLLSDRHGTRIGEMLLACRWVTERQRYCGGVLRLPLGDLTIQGSSPTRLEGLYAVTGGTRFYSGAGGQLGFVLVGLRKLVLYITVTT